MTVPDLGARVPLRLPSATATFAIGIAGYLGVNLSPYMISAAQSALGIDVLAASWLVTATLLLTAVAGLSVAPLCAGIHRRTVARLGLVLSVIGFAAAAFSPPLLVGGLLLGGLGAGGAVAASAPPSPRSGTPIASPGSTDSPTAASSPSSLPSSP